MRLGDLQLAILKVLWRLGAATVADVHEQLVEQKLAYTTIATMLRKMEDRGLVVHAAPSGDRQGRRFVFRPLVSEQEVTRGMTDDLVARLFDGNLASTVSHLLEAREVSSAELEAIEELIRNHKRGHKS
jgi:BlaI family transcriptional regulator, penicillinase repressor